MSAFYLPFPIRGSLNGSTVQTYRVALCKYDATAAPTVSNDDTQGYAPGSIWIDRTHAKAYVCVSNATGAAVWKEVGSSAGTVTSIDVSGGTTGLTTSGGPVTGSGTITLAGTLAVANGGTGATSAGSARTNLGATTVGGNVFTLTNPSAITFPRFNADNSVSALDAATFRTAIGAGTGSGTVTAVSITTANGVSGSSSGGATPALTITLGAITPTTVNALTLASQAVGFTIAGGTTSKTLTVSNTADVSGTNTGDQTITLTGNVTGSGTGSFATTIAAGVVTNAMLAGSIATSKLASATTTGGNLLALADPSAVTFIRINADNTVTALSASAFRTAIGAGTSSASGTVTSIDVSGGTTGLTFGGGPITSSGTITASGTLAVANGGTGAASAGSARTNLGLGTMATQDATAVAITGGSITGMSSPSGSSDVATKGYVDGLVQGIKWKSSVKVATTTFGTLSSGFANGSVIDGVTLATGDRILIKDQSSATENGIYTVNIAGAPTRALDADTGTELISAAVYAEQGSTNSDKAFVCTNNTITLGSTSISFVSFASTLGLSTVATSGLASDLTGTLSLAQLPAFTGGNVTGSGGSAVLNISASYVGQTSITTLGTITTGTWNGTPIATAYVAATLTGKALTGITSLGIRSTGAAFDLTIASTEVFTAGRTLTISLGDAARTLTMAGSATISGTNTGDQTITLTGIVTGSGTGSFATTIASNVVTNAMLATVATATFKGRTTAATGNVEDLTATQATALLNVFGADSGSGGVKGLVPATAAGDATKVLSGAGTWISVARPEDAAANDCRLSTESATYVSTSDRTSQGTIYLVGTKIVLKFGSNYVTCAVSNQSLAVSGSTGAIYDVWCSTSDGTTPAITFSTAWTNSTTRADALARTKFWHKSGDETKRYVGTICLSGTNVTEDSEARRYVFSAENRRRRSLRAHLSTASWSYATATWRRPNGGSATPGTNQVAFVTGLAEDAVEAHLYAIAFGASSYWSGTALSLDWSSGNPSTTSYGGFFLQGGSNYAGNPGIGSHVLDWLELSESGGATFYGAQASSYAKSGIYGTVIA